MEQSDGIDSKQKRQTRNRSVVSVYCRERKVRRDGSLCENGLGGLQNFQRNSGARFGIGQGVMVVAQIVAASGRYGMQLMIGQLFAERAAGCPERTIEPIFGIGHAIKPENGPQASLVERTVVGDQRQSFDVRGDVGPHFREIGGIGRVGVGHPMNCGCETTVKIGSRTDQPIKRIDDLPLAYDYDPYAAYAGPLAIGRLEIYGCKIFHLFCLTGDINPFQLLLTTQ